MSAGASKADLEPLVILPGMMCDARLLGPQIGPLSAHRSVIISPLIGADRPDQLAQLLLEDLPTRFALLGHGLGGIIAMEIMRRAAARVTRLALVATSPLSETPQEAAEREEWIVAAKAGKHLELLAKLRSAQHWAEGSQRLALREIAVEMARDMGAEVFVKQARLMQRRKDMQYTLRRCKIPTTIICGAQDKLYPVKRQEVLANLIPNSDFTVIQDAGHWPSLEAPAAFSAALRKWFDMPAQVQEPSQ